ncbi:Eco57I restriction-modification methylase domain-containing protein [Brachyspira hyodysenteriae]|uniref:Eco57I restriction-modification methylase domain-containing protein n=1 Tax=Brachyspira hyodysenteriae TaxID=159 RepID=UPI001EFA17C5|nr:TaqI-like C-terminal specificity domain-containing protein [Brachyspira hyodysenteriae]
MLRLVVGNDFYESQSVLDFDEETQYKINCFDWEDEFKNIFKGGGFDVVIGNPPYVRNRELDEKQKMYFNSFYKSADGQYDLYQLFYEKGINILKEKSILGYITSNKFTIASYGKKLREYILDNCIIKQIIDVSMINVFKKVSTYPYIIILEKNKENIDNIIKYKKVLTEEELLKNKLECIEQKSYLDDENKNFILRKIPDFFAKIDSMSLKLGDIVTIKETIHTGNVREKLIINESINNQCKKVLFGKNVHRYSFEWTGFYVNYDKSLIDKSKKEYGNLCEEKYFENPKILLRDISKRPDAIFDNEQYYSVNTLYSIQFLDGIEYNYLYLLGILNSNLIAFYFRNKFEEAHVSGGYLRFKKIYTSLLPIKKLDLNNKQDKEMHDKMVALVDSIIALNKKLAIEKNPNAVNMVSRQINAVDKQIDSLVYKLYNLSEDEIKIIEG